RPQHAEETVVKVRVDGAAVHVLVVLTPTIDDRVQVPDDVLRFVRLMTTQPSTDLAELRQNLVLLWPNEQMPAEVAEGAAEEAEPIIDMHHARSDLAPAKWPAVS